MPFSRELPSPERLEARLSPRSQYDAQMRAFNEAGVLQILPDKAALGIIGLDPEHPEQVREYPIPSFESILARLKERAEALDIKVAQGFVKLRLVPIAMPLGTLKQLYGEQLKTHHQNHQLFDSNGQPVNLDRETPVWAWEEYHNADVEGKLVYYPKSFDQNNHGGMTKQELIAATLNTPFPGWEVGLEEDLPNLPGAGQGQVIGGRKQIEANQTPTEYLEQPSSPEYADEEGFTPERELSLAIAELHSTNKVSDDYQGQGKISFLTGAFFPVSGNVPYAYFDRDTRRARLSRFNPDNRSEDCSARRWVRV